MKIHIMGASCAGSTTLGKQLAEVLSVPYFDTDEYFWSPSAIPYTVKREPGQRIQMLIEDLRNHESFIVGGSLVSWGEEWKGKFDLVVFLYVPPEVRLKRLTTRELERYGEQIYTNAERNELYKKFIDWAGKYEDRAFTGRSIQIHENWLKQVNCPVLEIRGDTTVMERINLVLEKVESLIGKAKN